MTLHYSAIFGQNDNSLTIFEIEKSVFISVQNWPREGTWGFLSSRLDMEDFLGRKLQKERGNK